MSFKNIVIAFGLLVAALRVIITPRLNQIPSATGTYEALSHLFVGFLIIVPFYDRKNALGPAKMYGWIGWILAFWEAGWFAWQKAHALI